EIQSEFKGEFSVGSLLLFAAIESLLAAVIIVPLAGNGKRAGNSHQSIVIPGLVFVFIVGILLIAGYYYFTNADRTLMSLWPIVLIATVLGALFSSGTEQKVKSVLAIGALALAAYILSAPLFNATEKYEA